MLIADEYAALPPLGQVAEGISLKNIGRNLSNASPVGRLFSERH